MFKPRQAAKVRELLPEGLHEAYCYGVVDRGTHDRKPYQGKARPPVQQIQIMFELTEVKRVFKEENGEEPCVGGIKFNMSFHEQSDLVKILTPWIGDPEEYGLENIVGHPAQITIKHNVGNDGKTYDNIESIAPMSPKLIGQMPPRHNKDMVFDIATHGFDSKEFAGLYPWLQNVIKDSYEYKQASDNAMLTEPPMADDSEIPF